MTYKRVEPNKSQLMDVPVLAGCLVSTDEEVLDVQTVFPLRIHAISFNS